MRRIAVAVLAAPSWTPTGIDPQRWRLALAEDLLDVLATLANVEAGVAVAAAESALLAQVGWPGLPGYAVARLDVSSVFAAVAADGYQQAALLAADAPDLPGMLIAKLLRPLSSHPLAAAAQVGGTGLLGLSAALPAPDWLPGEELDTLSLPQLRRRAPHAADVAAGTSWHRLRGPRDLARLDPRLEGWDATRALLGEHAGPPGAR